MKFGYITSKKFQNKWNKITNSSKKRKILEKSNRIILNDAINIDEFKRYIVNLVLLNPEEVFNEEKDF